MKVLLVEDDLLQLLEREHQIKSLGFDYTSCLDAATALEAYQQTVYPLVITDLGLPDIDGLEFCRRIRALPQSRESIILVISGRNTSEEIQTAMEAGADDFLSKPVNTELLRVRLTVLSQRLTRNT